MQYLSKLYDHETSLLLLFQPLNEMERFFKREICILNLLSKTSPLKNIRDSCNQAVSELNKYAIEIK